MTPVPVTDSSISGKYLASLLQKEYGFHQVECRIIRTGINHSYIVTTPEGKYVLRVYSFQWRSKLEIEEEIKLLNRLKKNGVAVSYPIRNLRHELILELQAPEGLRYGVLFSYAPGEKVRHFSAETASNIGMLMARLHQVTLGIKLKRITYQVDTLVVSAYHKAKVHFPETHEEMQYILQAEKRIRKEFETANTDLLRSGVVHLDIWYDNMQIKNESEITIFDFDFCGNGWLLHDMAYFKMQLYHTEPDKQLYHTKEQAFFSGYESVTNLPAEEKKLLPYAGLAIWIFYLGVQSERFDNWSNVFLSEAYLKRFMNMARDWMTFHQIEIETID